MNVTGSFVDLPTPTGPMRTYVYAPVVERRPPRSHPGLVLYSEIFQQTEPISRLAVQFSGQGYVVMVPEVYHSHLAPGTVLGYDDAGKTKGNELKTQTELSTFDDDARVVLAALRQHAKCNGRLGAVGFCLGGHLAFRCAFDDQVLAAACFFPTDIHSSTLGAGGKDDSIQRVRDIGGELLMVWGRQDPHIPYEGRLEIYRALHDAQRFFTWHEFNCAHAFMRDEGERYDPEVAHQCFRLAFDLFHRNL
jgi:carboxymethylenebutenolidase